MHIAHRTNEEIQALRDDVTCLKLPKQKNGGGCWDGTESSMKAEHVYFHHYSIYLRAWHIVRFIINILIFINVINIYINISKS